MGKYLKKNTLAIIAFISSLIGLGPVAAVLGHISLGQIKRKNDSLRGLALAAVILGWSETILLILLVANPYAFAYTVGYIWGQF